MGIRLPTSSDSDPKPTSTSPYSRDRAHAPTSIGPVQVLQAALAGGVTSMALARGTVALRGSAAYISVVNRLLFLFFSGR